MVVTINSVVVSAENEIIETFNNNDELSSLVLEIKHSSEDEAWGMDLDVTVVDGSDTDYYITGHDSFVRVSYSPDTYNHRITLFAVEKRLERITMPSLKFTQALDTTTYTKLDIIDRTLKLMIIEEYASRGGERVYDIAGVGTRDSNDNYIVGNLTGLALRLYSEKAPEFPFTTPTLKEICDEVLLTLGGHTIITGFTTIDIEYYEVTGSEITLSDVDEITGSQSIEKNAQKFDIYMENAISENNTNKQAIVYPSTQSWGSVRSQETELTTTNFFMEVSEEIERVTEFKILADVIIDYQETDGSTTNTLNFTGNIEVDATDYLLFKRAWESLDYEFTGQDSTGSTDTWFNSGYNKNNSLYIDGKSIKGWHEDLNIFTFGSSHNWNTFLGTLAWLGGYLTVTSGYWVKSIALGIAEPRFNTAVEDLMFRLIYVPKTSSRLQLEKDKVLSTGTLFANQSDRIVDSELLGQNLKSKLDREGAKELVFTKRCDYADRFKINDYWSNYKGVSVTNNRQSQHTLSILTLSKYYSNRSKRMVIANKPRMTEISGDTVVRNDIVNEYMILSRTWSIANNSYMLQAGIDRFLDTLDNGTITSVNPVELAKWVGVSVLLVSCISQGIENVLHFKFGFDNPVVAGTQMTTQDGAEVNSYFRYANEDGSFTSFNFELHGGMVAYPDTFAQRALNAQELPHLNSSVPSTMTLTEKYFDMDSLHILKDSGEIYNMTYQMTIVSDDDDILIGRKMATENLLVVKDSETLYIYLSLTKFTDKIKIPSSASQWVLTTGTAAGSEVKMVITSTSIRGAIQLTTNRPTGHYWAIGNSNRDLYFAVNHINEDVIYFNPKHKRSDL